MTANAPSVAYDYVVVGAGSAGCTIAARLADALPQASIALLEAGPSDDNVLIRTPEGTSLAATTNLVERISQDIRQMPGVLHTLATVGGTISGYWAIGSCVIATAPTITKTIESTVAKIGRSMKK